jgi:shikimate dehydrogenase
MESTPVFTIQEFLKSQADAGLFCAVLGCPITHSLSPLIHNMALKSHGLAIVYHPIHVGNAHHHLIKDLVNHPNFVGCNVTIPLKQVVIDYVEVESALVRHIGAANTLYKDDKGNVVADNTDVAGFLDPLRTLFGQVNAQKAIIFGSGGASRAVVYGLNSMGLQDLCVVSRTPTEWSSGQYRSMSYQSWGDEAMDSDIVVNTTPLGMYPNVDASPIEPGQEFVLAGKIWYDLIYRPAKSLFLKQGEAVSGICINGLDMFIGQAARSFEMFTGRVFPKLEARLLLENTLYGPHERLAR